MGGRPCTIAGDRTWEWPAVWANDGGEKGDISECVCVCDLGRVVGWASACGGRGYWIGLGPTGAPPHTYFDLLSVNDDVTRSPQSCPQFTPLSEGSYDRACPGALAPRRSRVRPAAADDERDRGPGHVGDAGTRSAHCRAPSAHRGADWRQGRWRGCAPRPVPFACWAQHHLTARHLGSQIRRGGRGQGRVGRRSRAPRRRSQRPAHASTGSRCGTS